MAERRSIVRVVSAEIQQHGRYLITQRSAKAVLPLLWEFPGGRVREGETDEEALVRAVQHRIGAAVRVSERVLEVRHDYDTYTVHLSVYRCSLSEGIPFAQAVHALAWVAPDEFVDYPFPDADQKTVDQLLSEA